MPTQTIPAAAHRGRRVNVDLTALALTVAALLLVLATSADFGIVWDEAYTVRRERTLREWFTGLFHAPPGATFRTSFSAQVLERSWPFSREEPDGHPPFYALLGLAGWWLTHDALHPLTAYRFGPMALCAATAGALYAHLARRRGWVAGLSAALLFLLMPRPFAHAHYARYDMPMTCLWLLAQVAFINSLRSPGWAVPFGIALGLGAGTKFTGCFAVAGPAAWVVWSGGRTLLRRVWHTGGDGDPTALAGVRALTLGVPIASLTLVVIQPPWWFDPVRSRIP
jgi:hypothetical protein